MVTEFPNPDAMPLMFRVPVPLELGVTVGPEIKRALEAKAGEPRTSASKAKEDTRTNVFLPSVIRIYGRLILKRFNH